MAETHRKVHTRNRKSQGKMQLLATHVLTRMQPTSAGSQGS